MTGNDFSGFGFASVRFGVSGVSAASERLHLKGKGLFEVLQTSSFKHGREKSQNWACERVTGAVCPGLSAVQAPSSRRSVRGCRSSSTVTPVPSGWRNRSLRPALVFHLIWILSASDLRCSAKKHENEKTETSSKSFI